MGGRFQRNIQQPMMLIDKSKTKRQNVILHIIIILFFLLISFIINKIPSGTFIAAGDFSQFISSNNNIKDLLYVWSSKLSGQGQYNPLIVAFPLYLFQNILFNLGFSYSNIANVIIFIFLISSFYSFYSSIKIINKDIPINIGLLSSGVYALNIFTFSIFIYPWGFTPHFVLYIFIPLIFALLNKLITDFSIKNISIFNVFFFIVIISFQNPVFLVALFILEILLFITFFITKAFHFNIKNIAKLLSGLVLQLLCSVFFILPFYISQQDITNSLSSSKIITDYANWLLITSPKIYSTMIFGINDFYLSKDIYSNSNILIAISMGYIIFLIISILFQKRKQEKNWLHYFISFVILFSLLMRLTPPFDKVNSLVYQFFKFFRSPEKLFVFYPFFYLILLSLLLFYSKFSRRIINCILILVLIIPFPFYIGGIPKYLSYKDRSDYSFTVKIPQEYYDIRKIINEDSYQLSIISLPYSVVNSINWVNYPKWHYIGIDVLSMLYNKSYISSNTYDHPSAETKLSFKEYNEAGIVSKEKFVALLQKFSGKYIILHKDITKDWIDNSQTIYNTIKALESNKILKQLDDNDYFTLYELDDNYLMPLISSSKDEIYFQKVSPVEYKIFIPNLKENTTVEFHQSYNAEWGLYMKPKPGINWNDPLKYYKNTKTTEFMPSEKIFKINDLSYIWERPIFDNTHQIVKDYANSWTIDSQFIRENYTDEYYIKNKDGSIAVEMVIYFRPQSYFYGGFMCDIFLTILSVGYLSGYFFWNKKKKRDLKNMYEVENLEKIIIKK